MQVSKHSTTFKPGTGWVVILEADYGDGRVTRYAMSSRSYGSLVAWGKRTGKGLKGAVSKFVAAKWTRKGTKPSPWMARGLACAVTVRKPDTIIQPSGNSGMFAAELARRAA